jgi:hypothetical protein
MPQPFPLILNPYDLDARGLVVDVALLLGSPAITLLPAPLEGHDRESVNAAAASAPEFLRLIQRWSWLQDLWREGVLRPEFADHSPIEYVREAEADVRSDPRFEGLSRIMRRGVFDTTHDYLRAICRDLSVGGAEPAVSVPVSVGLARMAHALNVPLVQEHARRASGSVVRQLETRSLRNLLSISIPLPRDISPEETAVFREHAGTQIAALREILSPDTLPTDQDTIIAIEDAFARAVRDIAGELELDHHARRGRRLSVVLISLGTMPESAPLAAALRASSLASARRAASRRATSGSGVALAPRPLRVLSVRELPWQDRH